LPTDGSLPFPPNDETLFPRFPLPALPADVAAAKTFGPFDAVDRFVSTGLRLRHILAECADVEHAAAIGDDAAILHRRASVEDLDALDLGGFIQPLDDRALAIVAGIALGRHDYGERGFAIPEQAEVLQLAIGRRNQRRDDVAHHPQHQHLAL